MFSTTPRFQRCWPSCWSRVELSKTIGDFDAEIPYCFGVICRLFVLYHIVIVEFQIANLLTICKNQFGKRITLQIERFEFEVVACIQLGEQTVISFERYQLRKSRDIQRSNLRICTLHIGKCRILFDYQLRYIIATTVEDVELWVCRSIE